MHGAYNVKIDSLEFFFVNHLVFADHSLVNYCCDGFAVMLAPENPAGAITLRLY